MYGSVVTNQGTCATARCFLSSSTQKVRHQWTGQSPNMATSLSQETLNMKHVSLLWVYHSVQIHIAFLCLVCRKCIVQSNNKKYSGVNKLATVFYYHYQVLCLLDMIELLFKRLIAW